MNTVVLVCLAALRESTISKKVGDFCCDAIGFNETSAGIREKTS